MKFPGFIGPSYVLRSVSVDCQRCVNMYPEFDETGTAAERSIGSLIGTPGLSAPLITLPTSPYRGSFVASNGVHYVCSGNKLYTVSYSGGVGSSTVIGTLLTAIGPVSMKDNGVYLMLIDGANGWYTLLGSTTLTKITSPNFLGAATQIEYQDGVFIFNIPGTNQFFVSDSLASASEGSTFSGLFDSKSTAPDPIVGIVSFGRNIWFLGAKTTEVWFDAGNAPPLTPFSLIQGTFVEVGLSAPATIKKINNTFLFLGQDDNHGVGTVYMAQGFQPVRVSTHAVELAFQRMGDISGTTAWAYQEDGHNFYVLNPKNADGVAVGNSSWCYDLTTSLWHERAYLQSGTLQRSLIEGHDYVANMHVVGDYQSGNLYKMSSSIYSDNGNPIQRMRVFPHLAGDRKRIFYQRLELVVDPGTGIDGTGQGTDPQVMMQFSDNGGHSWSNEKWTSLGKIGQKDRRVKWERLGQARDKVFKVVISDPVKVILIGAELDADQGMK